ncbi:MAG TPA: response regulator transcription factor [Clostridiales bacterium]|nr:response regulator transcription factor [Clostridiales bacterium]
MKARIRNGKGGLFLAKILIVEDEAKIARFLELELKHEGYEVLVAGDGRTGLEKALKEKVDLVVLDIMLPGLSGIEVCRRIRLESKMPIIMLTAKDDVTDKVAGLDMGADDYMTKPFAIEELLARIRVALNRVKNTLSEVKIDKLETCGVTLNLASHTAYFGDEELVLTKKEYELLEYLMRNKNIALTREQLLNNVWDYEYFGDTNVVDVYIRYLRQKIDEKYGIHLISTVRGVGYIIKEKETFS